MIIKLRNIGPIVATEFELGKLSVISGRNNTGKTYVTYLLYCFLDFWTNVYVLPLDEKVRHDLVSSGNATLDLHTYVLDANDILKRASKVFSQPHNLSRVFASEIERFKNSEIVVEVNNDEIELNNDVLHNVDFSFGTKNKSYLKVERDKNLLNIKLLVESIDISVSDSLDILERAISDIIKKIVFSSVIPAPFISSAERTGSAIFQKELDFATSKLVEVLRDKEKIKYFQPFNFLRSVSSEYPIPVRRNVDFIRGLSSIEKKRSFIYEEYPSILKDFSDIIGGSYKIDKKNSSIYYIPSKNKKLKLMMAESSSCVRSLLDLGYYIKHIAQKGDLLMIDEPEMNLHPENQIKVSKLFARLINAGLKIYITTHSDYILKELSTLVVLKQDNARIRKIVLEEKYKEDELLPAAFLRCYTACSKIKRRKSKIDNIELNLCKISQEFGIVSENFDDTIKNLNRIQDRIIWED